MEEPQKKKKKGWITLGIVFIITILIFIIAPISISLFIFLGISLPIILNILIYKWIKKKFAATIFSFSIWLNIIILLIPIIAGLVVYDLFQFSKEASTQPKYIVLEDNNLIFGIKITSFDFNMNELTNNRSVEILTTRDLQELQKEIKKGVKNKIVLLIDKEIFRDIHQIKIDELNLRISKQDAFRILNNEDPRTVISEIPLGIELPKDKIKAAVLFLLVKELIVEKKPEEFISELKNKNIKIYPERLSLKILINLIPVELIENLI